MPSTFQPYGHSVCFLGGYTSASCNPCPSAGPGFWGTFSPEANLHFPYFNELTAGPSIGGSNMMIAWMDGTIQPSCVLQRGGTGGASTLTLHIYRASPLSGTLTDVSNQTVVTGGTGVFLFQSMPTFTVTQRDRFFATLEFTAGPDIVWAELNFRFT